MKIDDKRVQLLAELTVGAPTDASYLYELKDLATEVREARKPIDMIIFCPRCGVQHVDEATSTWENPPHRSHLCLECGWIFRVADVPTNGVKQIQTHGEKDDLPIRGKQSLERMTTVRYYKTDLGSK